MRYDFPAGLSELPRVSLLTLPTPLERWPRLSDELGIHLYAKRDDLGGVGLGGNKLRKLELLLGKAKAAGATWLLTTGGTQSNHARLTAAVAAKLGLGCTLILKGVTDRLGGNLLLDQLFGAELRFVEAPDYAPVYQEMELEAARLRSRGETPFEIPLGGATAEGTAAYVAGCQELFEQTQELGFRPDVIAVAAGTASTYAGLRMGSALFNPPVRVVGISVSWTVKRLRTEAQRLIEETRVLLRLPPGSAPDLWFEEAFIGPGYARISEPGLAALKRVARSEGVVLDTTYTAKAFAGLIHLVQEGRIAPESQVVFVHTGGTPELFSRAAEELD